MLNIMHPVCTNRSHGHYQGPNKPQIPKPKVKRKRNRNRRSIEQLRRTRDHNRSFNKLSHKLKRLARNENCPDLKPLSPDEIELIRDTVLHSENLPSSGHLGKEFDDGHIEYKWKLISPGPDRMQHLITQMGYRFGEAVKRGHPQNCIYQIGVEDCGFPRGLPDDELVASISTVFLMAKQINAVATIECIKQGVEGKVATLTVSKSVATQDVDMEEDEKKQFMASNDIRLCVAGNASVGKSTLIGVLTRGKLDDGHGSARMNVFRHRHEVFYGRTSSISRHILGFNDDGIITNYRAFHQSEWNEIIRSSTKLVTFVDHPGHRRHFSTSVYSLTSHKPHYVMLTVSLDEFDRKRTTSPDSNDNDQVWSQMLSLNLDNLLDGSNDTSSSDCDSDSTSNSVEHSDCDSSADDKSGGHEADIDGAASPELKTRAPSKHIARGMRLPSVKSVTPQQSIDPSSDYRKYLTMCDSINVPPFICITKSDIDAQHSYTRLPKMLNKITKVVADKCGQKMTVKVITSPSEASRAARSLASSSLSTLPIIVTSSVNGEGLDLLKTFLFSLQSHVGWRTTCMNGTIDDAVEFGIDDIYHVRNVGVVVSGIVRSGTIRQGDRLSLGPSKLGHFRVVTVTSIHVRRKAVSYAFPGQMASFHLLEVETKEQLRRGMVLLDTECTPQQQTCYSFEADIDVLTSTACALREGSQPILHVENIRQSAHILHLHSNHPNGDDVDDEDGSVHDSESPVTAVFTFLHHPEFIRRGMKIIIRKSHGPIAIGRVTKLLDSADRPLVPLNSLQKPQRLRTAKHKTDFKHYLRKWNLDQKRKGEKKESTLSERELFSTTDDDVEIHSNRSMESIPGPYLSTNISASTADPNEDQLETLDESNIAEIPSRPDANLVMDGMNGVDRKHDENLIGDATAPPQPRKRRRRRIRRKRRKGKKTRISV